MGYISQVLHRIKIHTHETEEPPMKTVYLTTKFPPTVNSYYNRSKFGVHLSRSGRLFREAVAQDCLEQSISAILIDHPVSVDVILYPPDKRTRDLDNYMKALLDALTISGVWTDDSLIDTLTTHRGVVSKPGITRLRIKAHHGFILPNTSGIWEMMEDIDE